MPSLQIVERFVALVETGRGIEALDAFYADDACVRENDSPPRRGKAALVANETAAQAAVSGMKARCVRPIPIAGDTVVIRWVFDYVDSRGRPVHFEELAYQRWSGDRIADEQFFYDPAQFRAGV
jgi:ketosteroid isomerase-like protein